MAVLPNSAPTYGAVLRTVTAATPVTAAPGPSAPIEQEVSFLTGVSSTGTIAQFFDFTIDTDPVVTLWGAGGTLWLWLLNGGAVLAAATLANPGATVRIAAIGDFNGDGKADILWQAGNGTPELWLMNGTTVASRAALPDPGTAWQVIGAANSPVSM